MRLNNASGFAAVSGVSKRRSVLPRPVDLKTGFMASKVVPLYWDEVLPGDNIRGDIYGIVRGIPNIHATMDNAFLDIYGFFIPLRLLHDNFEKMITLGNDPSAWESAETGIKVPQVIFNSSYKNSVNSLADYLGVPLKAGIVSIKVNAYPFRAYNKCINDWFVNLNVSSPVGEYKGDEDLYFNRENYDLYTSFKLPDIYTLALPNTQRGGSVLLPLGNEAPVNANSDYYLKVKAHSDYSGWHVDDYVKDFVNDPLGPYITEKFVGSDTYDLFTHRKVVSTAFGPHDIGKNMNSQKFTFGVKIGEGATNLVADLSKATAITINELRLAFQTQLFLELNARCGNNRYIEYLNSVFGVSNGDARLQRSEYLFGIRNLVNVSEITQVSSTTNDSALGEVAGKVCNAINEKNVLNKAFTEHGIFMVVGVVRNQNSYSQGLPRKFMKESVFDFYNPIFDNIGEVAIKKNELFLNADNGDETFGFNEAWFNYRYGENLQTSYFRADAEGSLLSWTYGDKFESAPALDVNFLKSNSENINRTLTLQDSGIQFLANFKFDFVWTRPMAVHSIPGRIDHI